MEPARVEPPRRWVAPLIAWGVLVASILLPASGAGVPACPSKLITGTPCPGCGMTRSLTSLSHGDVRASWRYNPFGVATMVVVLWFAVAPLLMPAERRRRVERSRVVRIAGWVFLVLFVGHGVGRAAGWLPDWTGPRPGVHRTP